MFDSPNQFFEQALFIVTGQQLQIMEIQLQSGGCINQAVSLTTNEGDFFLKWNESTDEAMFSAEAMGLKLLKNAAALPVPAVLGQGQVAGKPFLLLEYLKGSSPNSSYWQLLGQGLAKLHQHSQQQYGLSHNNFIGSLQQNNEPLTDWIEFFIQQRLEPQLTLAYYQQLVAKSFMQRFRQLYPKLSDLLATEAPSLLHGDLWSGNVMPGPDGSAWIFDPAVYYGHREAEMAFTTLFGGFDPAFYAAYQEAAPLEPGYQQRYALYNLYPLLVHVNLFGASYLSGVERVLKKYC